MNKNSKERSKRVLTATFAAAIMLMIVIVPAVNASADIVGGTPGAERITNIGPYDGIVGDPHNSYAWCGEVFNQDGTDYLWVGSNRDMLTAQLFGMGLGSEYINSVLGTAVPSSDRAAKIYRLNLEAEDAQWELMYENDEFSGYRKMILFDDGLYVFSGSTNSAKGDSYVIYKFSENAVPMTDPNFAEPAVSLSVPLREESNQYFRAACIHDGKLFAGTFDSKLCYIGTGPEAEWTWIDIEADYELEYKPDGNMGEGIWDIISFNNALYVFMTGNGFRVYKITSDVDPYDTIEQIVGNDYEFAQYPAGLGVTNNYPFEDEGTNNKLMTLVAASPFIFEVEGTPYVYVTTFANGPAFLVSAATAAVDDAQLFEDAFGGIYCPATICRFDASDKWEVVVGDYDYDWDHTPKDSGGVFLDNIGNMRAGFYVGEDDKNPSANLYIWWMAEYDGKIYASTWDMIFFRDALPVVLAAIFANGYDGDDMLMPTIDVLREITALLQSVSSIDTGEITSDLTDLINKAGEDLYEALQGTSAILDVPRVLNKMYADITEMVQNLQNTPSPIDTAPLNQAITIFLLNAVNRPVQTVGALSGLMDAINVCSFYLLENSDPRGFDLFCSDDGLNFYPVTVNGFGDGNNYGGRVLLPTDYGLFVLTANPFTGCQVWLLSDDIEVDPVTIYAPSEISLKVGESVSFYVFVADSDLIYEDVSVTLGDGTAVSAKIKKVDGLGPAKYYSSEIDVFRDSSGSLAYVETPLFQLYEVTLKGLTEFEGELELSVVIGDEDPYVSDITLKITENVAGDGDGGSGDGSNWLLYSAVIVAVAVGLIAAIYFFVIRKA